MPWARILEDSARDGTLRSALLGGRPSRWLRRSALRPRSRGNALGATRCRLLALEEPFRRDELLDRLPILRHACAEHLATVRRDEDDVLDADADAARGFVDARLDRDHDSGLEGLHEGADVVDL